MSDWVSIEQWQDCVRMERPGIIFEVVNEHGQQMLTPCVATLTVPLDWTSPPTRFRAVALAKPRHSSPIPAPTSDSRPP